MSDTEEAEKPDLAEIQWDIVRKWAEGKFNHHIHREVFISEYYYRQNVTVIYQKTGFQTAAGVVAEAIRKGWIE